MNRNRGLSDRLDQVFVFLGFLFFFNQPHPTPSVRDFKFVYEDALGSAQLVSSRVPVLRALSIRFFSGGGGEKKMCDEDK